MTYACLRNYRPEYAALRQVSFAPSSLFKNGETGFVHDVIPCAVFTDDPPTVEAAIGEAIRVYTDLSGNGADAAQGTLTARAILRLDSNGRRYAEYDLTDDAYTVTLPAITGGTVAIFTRHGAYIDEAFNFAGSAFSWGTNTFSGARSTTLGLLRSLFSGDGSQMQEIGRLVIDRTLTAAEKAGLLAYYGARGCPTEFLSTPTTIKNVIPAGTTSLFNRFRSGGWSVIDNSGWDLSDVTTFQGIFNSNQITSIPSGLFDNCPDVTTFQGTFYNNQITSIPSGLFDNCPDVTTFVYTFNINQITSIPNGLFDNCPNVTDFSFTFSSNQITSIPSGLFDNCPDVTNFSFTFSSNPALATVPPNLFDTQTVCKNYANTFGNTNLTEASIDNVLVSIAYSATTNTLTNGTFGQSGGSAPSSTGKAAIDTLRGLGWTITVTGGY